MSDRKHVVVIGAGVIGAACAHYLTDAGWRVTVLDRGAFGRACSHANCGYVCPSHVLPLAMPGVFGFALKSMFDRASPFRVKPRLSLSLFRWMLGFARRCNVRDMLASGRGIDALLRSSRLLYDELIADGMDCEWETRGLLFVFRSKHGMAHYAATDELLRKEFNVPAKPFLGDEVCELEPALKPGLGGGWLYETDAHLRPDRLMRSWHAKLEARGVAVRENCEVTGFVRFGGTATAVRPGDSRDAFVLAASADPVLNDHLLSHPDPARQGPFDHDAPAGRCPTIPVDFRGTRSRRRRSSPATASGR